MKKITLLLLILSLASCKWLKKNKDEICEAVTKSDLIVNDIKTEFQKDEDEGKFYKISGFVLNTVADLLSCQENIAPEAGESDYRQKIIYSTTPSFSDGKTVDIQDFQINPLPAKAEAQTVDNITFVVDGYYQIDGEADFNQQVDERNEENNEKKKSVGGRANGLIGNHKATVLEIRGTAKRPFLDRNGKEVYLIRKNK